MFKELFEKIFGGSKENLPNGVFHKIQSEWDQRTKKAIEDFIRIPALSIEFDPDWQKSGHLDKAIEFAADWAKALNFQDITLEKIQDEGFPPCLFADIPGTGKKKDGKTVFLYGHFDKQPENVGWDANKSAWTPVEENGRLYGRGGADDGYAWFCSLSALKAMDECGIDRPHCVALFETAEESGSQHYRDYIKKVLPRLGDVGLVVVLDSACPDYERLWVTQSLRGRVGCTVKAQVLKHGVHSGEAGGIVPSSFMVLRALLDRIENPQTGEILLKDLLCEIPEDIKEQTKAAAAILGDKINTEQPWAGQTHSLLKDPYESLLNRNWGAALSVVGAEGLPPIQTAGNVLRPETTIKIGIRIPPLADPRKAEKAVGDALTQNPPFNADIKVEDLSASCGWNAPATGEWLKQAFNEASLAFWDKDPAYLGIGASIPLVSFFSQTWPNAAFMVAGVLGPESNAHGPNEFLHLDYALKLTASVATVIGKMPCEVPAKAEAPAEKPAETAKPAAPAKEAAAPAKAPESAKAPAQSAQAAPAKPAPAAPAAKPADAPAPVAPSVAQAAAANLAKKA